VSLVRIQVLLSEAENNAVRLEARREHVSVSEIIRRQVRPLVKDEFADESDSFFKMIGSVSEESATDLSTHHDTYLYGSEFET
jgi:hypothetical protein